MATIFGQKNHWCKLGMMMTFMEVKANRGQIQWIIFVLPLWYLVSGWGLGSKVCMHHFGCGNGMNWIKGFYMIVKVKIETFWFSTYSMEMHSLTYRHPLLSAYEARRLVREPSCIFSMSKDSTVLQVYRFVKSRVVAWWCFLWLFLSVNICINLQKRHPLYYVDQWLLFCHSSDIPTHEEKCCCEKTEV